MANEPSNTEGGNPKKKPLPTTRDKNPPGAALNGGFAEAQSGAIKLDTEDPKVVQDFILWLYTPKTHTGRVTKDNGMEVFNAFAALGIFADRRGIPLLMNEVIDSWKRAISDVWALPAYQLTEVYNETPENSPLRRFLIRVIASIATDKVFADEEEVAWTQEVLLDLSKAMLADPRPAKLSRELFQKLDTCLFHIHGEGTRCANKSPMHANKGSLVYSSC